MANTDRTIVFVECAKQHGVFFRFGSDWQHFEKARPPSAAVKFHIRRKKQRTATGTMVDAFIFFGVQRTGKCTFGPFLTQDTKCSGVGR